MKKFLVLLVLFAAAAYAVAGEMTVDDLLAKHLKAIGGEKNVRAVESFYMQGTFLMQGMPLRLKVHLIPPDKGHMELSMNNVVMGNGGTNGKEAWQTQMGETYYSLSSSVLRDNPGIVFPLDFLLGAVIPLRLAPCTRFGGSLLVFAGLGSLVALFRRFRIALLFRE